MSITQLALLEAPGRERPDYTIFSAPAANIVDNANEEVELDQALSLAGRQGRDFLGIIVQGLLNNFAAEHLTIGTADHDMSVDIRLNSRTGTFSIADPENIWYLRMEQSVTAPTTATSEALNLQIEGGNLMAEPFLYVAPRLFFRIENEIDATLVAGTFSIRMASISKRLDFQLFIELLERFADVTLL